MIPYVLVLQYIKRFWCKSYTWAPSTGLSCITCPNPIASPLHRPLCCNWLDTDGCTSAEMFLYCRNASIIERFLMQLFVPEIQSVFLLTSNPVSTEISHVPGGSTSYIIMFPLILLQLILCSMKQMRDIFHNYQRFRQPFTNHFCTDITQGCAHYVPIQGYEYIQAELLFNGIGLWWWRYLINTKTQSIVIRYRSILTQTYRSIE